MRLFEQKKEFAQFLDNERNHNNTVGLVPTMGALHKGHISLVKRALLENDTVVVSIFVNPTQFDNKDDLQKYPRSLEKDLAILQQVSPNIAVFAPTVDAIYDGDVQSQSYEFEGLDEVMEGESREGHFDGVGTIVELLLRTVQPDRAYFGEKDFQQLMIVRKMVALKGLPVEIVPCPIEREPHGLAMSSRNERLSKTTRKEAGFIHKTLQSAKSKFGTESAYDIAVWVEREFEDNEVLRLEYFQIADEETLRPLAEQKANIKYRAFIAVYADDVRLIDNLRLN